MHKRMIIILVIYLFVMDIFSDTLKYRLNRMNILRISINSSFLPNEQNNSISSEHNATFYLPNYFSPYFFKSYGFNCYFHSRYFLELGVVSKIFPHTKYGLRINNFICIGYSVLIDGMDMGFGCNYGISARNMHYYQSNIFIIGGSEVKYQIINPRYFEFRISKFFVNKFALSFNFYLIRDKGFSDVQYFSGATGGYRDYNFNKTFYFSEIEINYFIRLNK